MSPTVTIAGKTFEAPTSFKIGDKTYAKADGTPFTQRFFDGILSGAASKVRAQLSELDALDELDVETDPAAEDALYERLYGKGV